jgi:hypothetical protein
MAATMNIIDNLLDSYKVISTHNTLHRADTQGVRIGKVEVVEMAGRRFRNTYWYNYSIGACTLDHVDGVEIK